MLPGSACQTAPAPDFQSWLVLALLLLALVCSSRLLTQDKPTDPSRTGGPRTLRAATSTAPPGPVAVVS
ncbi:hypothetical protein LJY25_14130 [Hymenobacter sp. BT175]|uniref:hypothetical protein n=1 Tax=Hymenobacter translucens TaxID=2886507 RepID=UPI001D0E46F5|nr:hypothetical protein [Hymenobacter translucens]MCC2547591.1 hypothetical protein [Hymenobacter translucens]